MERRYFRDKTFEVWGGELKRIKYKAFKVVDGDTVKILVKGKPAQLMSQTVRIVGIDTEEMTDDRAARRRVAIESKMLLSGLMRSYIKPRFLCRVKKSREGWPMYETDAYGRLLCVVKVWHWPAMKWLDYADIVISMGLHKKGSKWNKKRGI